LSSECVAVVVVVSRNGAIRCSGCYERKQSGLRGAGQNGCWPAIAIS